MVYRNGLFFNAIILFTFFALNLCFKCSVDANIAFDSFEWDFSTLETNTANLDGNIKDNYLLYWNLDSPVNVEDAGYLCQKSYACMETVSNGFFIPSGNRPMCDSLFGDDKVPPTAGRRLIFQTSVTNQTDFSADTSKIVSATTYIDVVCPNPNISQDIVDYVPQLADSVYMNYISNAARAQPYISESSEMIKDDSESGITMEYNLHLTLYSFSGCPYHTQETAKELIIILIILAIIVVYLVPVMLFKRYFLLYHGGETYPNYNFWCLFKKCMKMGLKTILTPFMKLKVFFKVRKQTKMELKRDKINKMKQIAPYIDCNVPIPFRVQQPLSVPYGFTPKDDSPVAGAISANLEGNGDQTSELSGTGKDDNDAKKNKVANFKKMWHTAMNLMNSRADKALLPDITKNSARDKSLSRLFLTSFVDIQFKLARTTKLSIVKVPKNPKHKGYLNAKIANNARIERIKRLFGGEEFEEDGRSSALGSQSYY